MARGRDILVVDIPGLRVGDVQSLTPSLPNLHKLAGRFSAALVPIASGSLVARRATLVTGVLPTRHGLARDDDASLQVDPFWKRAPALRPGVRTAYAGSCTPAGIGTDFFHLFDHGRPVWMPDRLRVPLLNELPAPLRKSRLADTAWAFVLQALNAGIALVWLECGALLECAGDQRAATLSELDAALGALLKAARHRVVVLLASTATCHATDVFDARKAAGAAFTTDHRVLHVHCGPAAAPRVAQRLAGEPGLARVLTGADRHELGLMCPTAGDVVAELRPGWAFAAGKGQTAWAHAGPDSAPADLPVLLARGLTLPKATVGMCEVAWILQHVLTGQEYRDEG